MGTKGYKITSKYQTSSAIQTQKLDPLFKPNDQSTNNLTYTSLGLESGLVCHFPYQTHVKKY